MDGIPVTPGLGAALYQVATGIGHNSQRALPEILIEETAALKATADKLVASAGRAVVTDDETASRATTLVKLIGDAVRSIEAWHQTTKAPYLAAGRAVDDRKNVLCAPLANAKTSVVSLLDAYRRRLAAEAEAERKRLAEEAEAARKAAEEAARAAAADGSIESLIEAEQAAAKVTAVEHQIKATVAEPIRGFGGTKATGRVVLSVVIDDWKVALKHCQKIAPDTIKAAIQRVYDDQLRAKVTSLPGARIVENSKTIVS